MKAEGGCLCGAVRFRADGVSKECHVCHCGMCRSWSGGPVFSVQSTSVDFTGEEQIRRYQSSDWAERAFCERCGTHLFYFLRPTGEYYLWAGAFDDPAVFHLAGEIFIDDKPEGYAFAGDHPRLTGAEVIASMGGEPPP